MTSLLAKARNNADLPLAFINSLASGRKNRRLYEEVETYCMFIGYGRSGHSLVGSLLDSHPEAAIAHELDAMRYFQAGFGRDQVYALILDNERQLAERGRSTGVYNYAVPDQWQGRFQRLRVIGDKKGGRSTFRMLGNPGLVSRVRRAVGVPIRFIHVARNPYDNITTMRLGNTLEDTIDRYFTLCQGVAETKRLAGEGEVLDLHHEAFLAEPKATLRQLCHFVGLEADEAYLDACASILYTSANKTRSKAPWTPELISAVEKRMAGFSFLDGYSFES